MDKSDGLLLVGLGAGCTHYKQLGVGYSLWRTRSRVLITSGSEPDTYY